MVHHAREHRGAQRHNGVPVGLHHRQDAAHQAVAKEDVGGVHRRLRQHRGALVVHGQVAEQVQVDGVPEDQPAGDRVAGLRRGRDLPDDGVRRRGGRAGRPAGGDGPGGAQGARRAVHAAAEHGGVHARAAARAVPGDLRLCHRAVRRVLCVRLQAGLQDQGLRRLHPGTRRAHGQDGLPDRDGRLQLHVLHELCQVAGPHSGAPPRAVVKDERAAAAGAV
mmetsp:Transcript_10311/g.35904  ORF Transcript_10311/g.35904 Transcript_10311/m.35904 type:complete len:221 (+) Transcript_10311:710-1372(+)